MTTSNFFQNFGMLAKRGFRLSLFVAMAAWLSACGSGAVSGDSAVSANGLPSMTLTLTELATSAPRTAISFSSPAKVNALVRSASGTALAGVVVTFATNSTLGVFSPATGTALTDANGLASVILNAAGLSASGATTVSAAAQVTTTTAVTPLSQSLGYSVGAANVSISAVNVQTPSLSAFGTTGVSVTVSSSGAPISTPLEVRFSSPCASSGRAALTATATTISGVANATYRDIGCASLDTVTATISGTTISSSGIVTVSAPAVGSIQFVSAQPNAISLRGTGGAGRQETSLVTFRVVDVSGRPVGGRIVDFTLNTNVGGITLTPSSATSDVATGLVVTNVQSGTVSTPVRVTARTVSGTQTLTTQSDQLTISTGVPSQDGFSLSVSALNIEGGERDGATSTVIARLADRYRNPAPDGTVVNFTASGGSIISSCTTAAGACSSTLTSQNFRPANGRVAILAYAIGEETFRDTNGNGWFDTGELFDQDGNSSDLPEAWLDVNENGVRDATEPFIDFNSNSSYDSGDGRFNGVSCDDSVAGRSTPGSCGSPRSVHVRGRAVVVFSGSNPRFSSNLATIALTPCNTTSPFNRTSATAIVTIRDRFGNVMPAGTIVAFATSNGVIVSTTATFTVPNTIATFLNTGVADNIFNFAVTVESDASQTITSATLTTAEVRACTNARSTGILTVTVTTPSGLVSTFPITVTD